MKQVTTSDRTRSGFTILELLIVISIIAIIATLATGAATKSMRQSRIKRITTMATGLEIAMANYRAQENAWPFDLSDCVQDRNDSTRYWLHGVNNAQAFRNMYHGPGGQSKTVYLDAGAYLATADGRRLSLQAALSQGKTDAAIGYPQPENANRFCYYCICYNPLTDTIKVVRQDTKHSNADGGEFDCPEWNRNP